jgi:hypothetical protein
MGTLMPHVGLRFNGLGDLYIGGEVRPYVTMHRLVTSQY